MTRKEYDILGEIRSDIKALLKFQAESGVRIVNCKETFATLKTEQAIIRKMAQWSINKILLFTGGVLVAGAVAGLLVKLL